MGSGDLTQDPGANDTGIHWPNRPVGQDAEPAKISVPSDGVTLGVVVALSLTAFLVLVLLLVLLARKCMRRNLKFIDLDLDEDVHITTSRSAPSTRSTSPHSSHPSKERRCSLHKPDKTTLVRSVAMESMPDFQLPSERIQPLTTNDMDRSAAVRSILQYQHHLLGHLSPDISGASIRTSEGESDTDDMLSVGSLTYSVTYNAMVETLHVHVVKAENLRGRGSENAPRDPFVKVYLLPDERQCKQSRVVKGSLSPVFKEDFDFEVAVNDVRSRTLRLSVYEVDKRRMRHALGHVFVPLCDVDLSLSEVVTRELDNDSQTTAGLGELFVSLCFNAQTDKLKVVLQRGRDLRKLDFENQKIYIKVQLLYGHRIQKTKKSSAISASNDPMFNEAFNFTLSCKQLDSSSLRVYVMIAGNDKDGDTEYGRITLGSYMNARGEALLHWQEMISNYRQSVARWHLLSKAKRSNSMESTSSE